MAKNIFGSLRLNILLLLILSGVILYLTAWGLEVYTRHDIVVHIPELRGKDLTQARGLLETADLRHEVIDSIYDPNEPGGTVADLVPSAGSAVKPGRIVFIKIYAYEPRKISLPYVKDLSVRQAEALLRSQGFERIELKEVPGDYLDLAIGTERADGTALAPGTMLSKNTPIVLLITGQAKEDINLNDIMEVNDTAGQEYTDHDNLIESDSLQTNNEEQEQWW